MKFFYIKPPVDKELHTKITSLYGASYLIQYKEYAIPVFYFETVYKFIYKDFPSYAKLLLTSPRFQEVRDYYNELLYNNKNFNSTDSNFDFPYPDDVTPKSYQKSGVEQIYMRFHQGFKGCLLGDEPGVGKTWQAVFFYNLLHAEMENSDSIDNVLIVCPNTLKSNWKKEWIKTYVGKLKAPYIITPDTTKAAFENHSIFIINFDLLIKFKKQLVKKKFGYIIVDEAHAFCNNTSGRSKVLRDVSESSYFNLLLSGTPIRNYVKDLRHLLFLIDRNFVWGNQFLYEATFCDVKQGLYGKITTGASNQRLLRKILRMHYLIRRKKNEVLDQLPKKQRSFIAIDTDKSEISNSNKNKITKFKQFNILEDIPREKINSPTYQQMRIDIGLIKLPIIVSEINNIVSYENPIVLYIYHKKVMELARELLRESSFYIDGSTKPLDREKYKNQFQDGVKNIITLSFDAAREGITLHRSNRVICCELVWSPMDQMEDRIHRVGQERKCFIDYYYIPDTIDEYIAGKIGGKNINIKRVIG